MNDEWDKEQDIAMNGQRAAIYHAAAATGKCGNCKFWTDPVDRGIERGKPLPAIGECTAEPIPERISVPGRGTYKTNPSSPFKFFTYASYTCSTWAAKEGR